MNENLELLEYLYKNSEMGVSTTTKLLKTLNGKENKIKFLVEEQLKSYEKFQKESSKLIKKYKMDVKENSMMSKMSANMGVKMEVMKDNSDSSIAQMMIQGITMGIVEIESKIKNYKGKVDEDILTLTKEYKKTLENQEEEMKKFL